MADAQVTFVVKPHTTTGHDGITHVGGHQWRWDVPQVIASIEGKQNTFFTLENGVRADIGVVNGPSGKYLRTYADQKWTDNLLALPRQA